MVTVSETIARRLLLLFPRGKGCQGDSSLSRKERKRGRGSGEETLLLSESVCVS